MRRLFIWAAIEFALLAIAALVRNAFWTYGADAGTFAQLISSFPAMRDALEAGSHFRFHWSPSLALLWPLVALVHGPLLLQLLQAAAVVSTAPLLALLFRPYLGETLAVRFGGLALLYPPLVALGFDEFHELGVFPPLAIAMLLAADRARWGWFAVCTVIALGLREDVCIELALCGVALAIGGVVAKRRDVSIAGGTTAAAAAGVLTLYYAFLIPKLGGWNPSHFYSYPFASGPLALVAAIVTHPLDVARVILMPGKGTYVLEALAPLALLPLLSRWWIAAVPGFAIVLLANDSYVWRMGDHYAALWIPWLLVAAGAALYQLRKRSDAFANRWVYAAMAVSTIVLVAFDPMHPLHYLQPAYRDTADANRAFGCVPHDALVATHDEWYAARAVDYPNSTTALTGNADYLIYASDYPNAAFQSTTKNAVARAVKDGEYRVICRFGAVAVYQRVK